MRVSSVEVYIACRERHEAAEAYAGRLSKAQIEAMLEHEGDYWMSVYPNGEAVLSLIEDEG